MEGDSVTVRTIVSGIDTVVDAMAYIWEVMVTNPVLLFFISASLLCVGIKIFRKIKNAAK